MAALGFSDSPDVLKLHFFSDTCEGLRFFDCPFEMLRRNANSDECYVYEEDYHGQVDESDLNPDESELEMWKGKADKVIDFLEDMTMGRQRQMTEAAIANKKLKEEVIDERKKVAESEEGWRFSVKMWGAEADFLNMDSAKSQPEEFNEFLKDAFDEETYKKMYDEFELAELLEGYECYCSECADALEKPDPTMTDKEFEEWFEEAGGYDIMCEKCKEDYDEDSEDEE